MTPSQLYIAEAIATHHVDGLLSRREALRRLAVLGIGTAAGTALIAACGNSKQTPAASSSSTIGTATTTKSPTWGNWGNQLSDTAPGMDHALPTEPISWSGPHSQLQGAWAEAPNARGGLLVIHQNKGLTPWAASVAGRFAGAGYSGLAIDLLSEEGGTARFIDRSQAQGATEKISPDRFVADMKSGVDELQRRVPGKKLAVVGFRFGGGLVWRLLASGEPQLAAAVPFYGPLPDNPDFSGSKAAVLAFYADGDTQMTAAKDVAKAALDKAGLVNQIVVEPNVLHGFFNDAGKRYKAAPGPNNAAATDAWHRGCGWRRATAASEATPESC